MESTGPDSTTLDSAAPDSAALDSTALNTGRPATNGDITLSLTATPVLSYALAHNRINVVGRVGVDNRGPAVREAVLRLEVLSAGDTLGTARDLLVDLAAERTLTFTDVSLTVDPTAMLLIEEQRPAEIRASLLVAGVVVAEAGEPIQLLAAQQWIAQPVDLALEMLSAHVLPNHPEIATLLAEAAAALEARTGSAAMPGYQSGPDRVDQVVEAVFVAMRSRTIRYATPPASWSDDGQKVRTPGEVLGTTTGEGTSGGVGTCLDTVVVMAAALEQAGLHPLLWVVAGHAFLGYWREEETLGAPALTDVAEVINLIDLDLIRLVETTQVTDRDTGTPVTFAQAQRSPYLDWLADLATVIGVVDVVRSRRTHILPLPARTVTADGTVVVTEYRPAGVSPGGPVVVNETDAAANDAADAPTAVAPSGRSSSTPPRISQWKNALLDLSLRNRLINFTERGALALTVPDQHLAGVEDLVTDGAGLTLLPADRMTTTDRERGIRFGRDLPADQLAALLADKKAVYADVTDAAYATKLRALAYKARTVVQETGANNLYLAFGSLVWTANDRELRSPLVLVPVVLEPAGRGGDYRVRLDEAGASTPNYCLLEKLRQLHGLTIDGLATPAADATGIDLAAAFRATREALLAAGLPYRVEETLDLSILQFAKFRLWKDLDENWQTLAENSLVSHLVHTPTQPFVDPVALPAPADLDALGAECPVPGDSSQLAAVAEAIAERTFVLEGPPGTGKSQTITNLLTRAVYEGKKVLFVAEKRAALQVVQARLNEVGMGPFALDLHDKASKPATVRAQIRQALEHEVTVDGQGLKNDLDVLGTARRSLARYTDRLHEQNGAGLSFYSARTAQLTADVDVRALPVPADLPARITADELDELRRMLRDLPDVTDPARPRPQHPWAFITTPPAGPLDLATVARAALELDEALAALPRADETAGSGAAASVVAAAASPTEFVTLSSLAAADRVPLVTLDGTRSPDWASAAAAAEQATGTFVQAEHPALTVLEPGALRLDAAALHRDAQAADASSFFGRRGRRKAVLARLAAEMRPGAKLPLGSLTTVTGQLADSQARLHALRGLVLAVDGVSIADDWNPLVGSAPVAPAQTGQTTQTGPTGRDELAARLAWLRWAGGVVASEHRDLSVDFVAALRGYLDASTEPDAALATALNRALLALQAVMTATGAGPAAMAGWAADGGLVAVWSRGREERDAQAPGLPTLTRWIALLEHLEPLARLGLPAAHTAVLRGEVDADDAGLAFEKGLATASVAERGSATTLDQFDAAAQNRSITRFTTSSGAVRRHLPTFIPYSVLRRRTIGATPDAAGDSGNPGTETAARLGLLKRQLDRQRGGMGVRELMHEFGDLITDILPCMLMSPESVARFFPAQAGLFDIVVFDEASQVRVSDAVGAMGRARSVVVVGDSKQMPPTSFAESTIGSGEEDGDTLEFVRDEESILSECVQAQVPSKWLSWHYRSQDESLIAFSNRAYYRDRLSSFPAPHHGAGTDAGSGSGPGSGSGSAGYGVSLRRVDGQFLRSGKGKSLRTNPVEAQAIVAEILARFAAEPEETPSIGVITFNVQQRALIEGSLRDSGDERIVHALDTDTDGLFVKNLENVQGDERDTILFSTAFSADASGRLPLNFGPLNLPGGERRLNVAITRARRQVIVFSSFAPADLRAEETISAGVKDLRAYLDLAAGGADGLATPLRQSGALDRHREEIAEALRERGFAVQADVGLSDFRVDLSVATTGAPGHPVMAVLLDGPTWAARRTVSDRDGLPVEVLSRLMGWPAVERVWLPEWLDDRDAVLDRLAEKLDALDAARQAHEAAALA
ncbi:MULTISPECIES: DUF4011 domain-containing protein [unclassified Cryobacterium]|uniref:DUF4011 domain-containing protein n=1 Tax=unclassified Cryobacterium TaxID=2649013 RepID=UPI00106D0FE5|nr:MULTISPECIES: DUF4011 domain-containing protein [unclassified Cryobacterium]TFC54965.1 DUF4011 domain-containing protein [Cryobacterium sp. TMB3-1-2]TFC70355.1 DUF4011 domain-containing protein [Cryobacterium sp. TMB3-15]TFC75696.1 DUF4011 domain-containing protein [Cryobacterium sp. TMB3-10]TFD45466.1 DUF4011 domain-containing protein [Cryobacterium sp. TMB3-12]